jgi:hypothetical protein
MYIFLDSNILVADPWFRSQRMRMLFDYSEKTLSRIILVAPVHMEVRAHFKRRTTALIAAIQSSFNAADRNRVKELPDFNGSKALSATIAEWEQNFLNVVRDKEILHAVLDDSVLPEALKRAVERIPPCTQSGKEMRDTIIWLSILSVCKRLSLTEEPFAFISDNIQDFAGPDKTTLRVELKEELEREKLEILYYPSLDHFIKVHAQKIAHIDINWLQHKIDSTQLESIFLPKAQKADVSQFEISQVQYRDNYTPSVIEKVLSISVDITGPLYVWSINQREIKLSAGCRSQVEADVECIRTIHPKDYERYEEYPLYSTLRCSAKMNADINVFIRDDEVTLVEAEDYEYEVY